MTAASEDHHSTDTGGHTAAVELDESWWAAAAAGMGDDANLGQPELWFSSLLASAKEAPPGSLQQRVLEAMAMASSAMLAADNWSAPFTPAMQWEGRRSHIPEDLTDEQKELLSRVAPPRQPYNAACSLGRCLLDLRRPQSNRPAAPGNGRLLRRATRC